MPNKYAVLSVTTLGAMMAAIDSTIVFLALPDIGDHFAIGVDYLSLIVVMYLVATTTMMIPSVGLARRFGKKRLYLLGFLLFTVSSFLIVISPNILSVVVFRSLEGCGAGIMSSLGIPILMDAFEKGERGRAVGISSVSWSIGTLVGPVLGGLLVTYDWRYIFLINVPIGIAALVLGKERIPTDTEDKKQRIAVGNLAGFLVFVIPLVIGISFLNTYWLLAVALLSPIFLFTQARDPIVTRELLRNRSYMLILSSTALQALAFFGVLYALSIYFQNDLGMSPLLAGFALASYPVASMIASPLGGYLLDKTRRGAAIMISGVLLQGISIIIAALLLHNVQFVSLMLFLAGFGGSLYWSASTTVGIDVGPPWLRSAASGTMFTFRNIALIVGLAMLPVFITAADQTAVGSSLLILGKNINVVSAISNYILFTGLLSILAAVLIVPYHFSLKRKELDTL